MSVAQRVTEAEYEHIVWADPEHKWELVDGRLREKPGMSWEHGEILIQLGYLLRRQLDRRQFSVLGESRVRRPPGTIFIPDVFVAPITYGEEFRDRPGVLAIMSQPLPLVIEVWSRSTGDYDVAAKIPVCQERGDLEIWRVSIPTNGP
jgi:Uma2 family endonuclease